MLKYAVGCFWGGGATCLCFFSVFPLEVMREVFSCNILRRNDLCQPAITIVCVTPTPLALSQNQLSLSSISLRFALVFSPSLFLSHLIFFRLALPLSLFLHFFPYSIFLSFPLYFPSFFLSSSLSPSFILNLAPSLSLRHTHTLSLSLSLYLPFSGSPSSLPSSVSVSSLISSKQATSQRRLHRK